MNLRKTVGGKGGNAWRERRAMKPVRRAKERQRSGGGGASSQGPRETPTAGLLLGGPESPGGSWPLSARRGSRPERRELDQGRIMPVLLRSSIGGTETEHRCRTKRSWSSDMASPRGPYRIGGGVKGLAMQSCCDCRTAAGRLQNRRCARRRAPMPHGRVAMVARPARARRRARRASGRRQERAGHRPGPAAPGACPGESRGGLWPRTCGPYQSCLKTYSPARLTYPVRRRPLISSPTSAKP